MSVTCREITELLVDYVDGSLPSEECQRLEAHLCGCRTCDHFLQSYRVTILLTRRLPCEALPPELTARLKRFLEDHHERGASAS